MLKTSSFALMHFSIAFGVTYLLTGDLMVGGLVAVIEPAINTVGYVFHEKNLAATATQPQQRADGHQR